SSFALCRLASILSWVISLFFIIVSIPPIDHAYYLVPGCRPFNYFLKVSNLKADWIAFLTVRSFLIYPLNDICLTSPASFSANVPLAMKSDHTLYSLPATVVVVVLPLIISDSSLLFGFGLLPCR